jgi:hypothetical protein
MSEHCSSLISVPKYLCVYVSMMFSAFDWGINLSSLPLDPRFEGSNPNEDDVLSRAIKIRSTTSFGGEVKPMFPCRKILRHVKYPYSMKEILLGKILGYLSRCFSCFANRYI